MRLLGRIAAFTALGLGLAAAATIVWLSRALPVTEGRLSLPGLQGTVTVTRDGRYGIPRIEAANAHDAYFALGFVHAQDRLWQMESQRLAGAGRLSETVGEATLPSDRMTRLLGLYRLAEQSLPFLDAEVMAALEAYSAGVNAWIDHHSGPLPPEFLLLGHRPAPWRPADSLVWGRIMAMQLAGNWHEELTRADLARTMSPERVDQLWPPYPSQAPTTAVRAPDALLAATPEILEPRLASNVWVINGARSETGQPLLANDPHLGFNAPILWYLAAIHTPDFSVTGATIPGVPFHLLGHNGHIAWGITTTHSDTQDLFIERPDGDGYDGPGGPLPFATRKEVIKIKGGGQEVLTIRESRHGPIISDLLGERARGQILALASPAFQADDRTAQALYKLNHARDWHGFLTALRDFHAPQQNIAYADTTGNIGFLSPGRVPIRKGGQGLLPQPGWDGAHDWTGWVPFEALPRLFNPPAGRIVNANNKVVGEDYPYLLAAIWPEPYRAERIAAILDAKPRHGVEAMGRMQMDGLSMMAAEIKPLLLALVRPDDRTRPVVERLRAWDDVMDRDRPEPLIFNAWLHRLQTAILDQGQSPRIFNYLKPLFLNAALSGGNGWCEAEGCGGLVTGSLIQTLDNIEQAHGKDINSWRWGTVHQAWFEHGVFSHVPLLGPLTRLTIATDGDDFTVNRGSFDPDYPGHPFAHRHGAGYRAVYDLSNLDNSRFVIATGQSGIPFSSHYGDFLGPWRDGESIPITRTAEQPHILTLAPSQQDQARQ